MNVVYISDVATIGGATESLFDLVNVFNEREDVNACVLTSSKDSFSRRLSECGIANYAVGHGAVLQAKPHNPLVSAPKYLIRLFEYLANRESSLRKSVEILRDSSIDIVHTNVERTDLGSMLSCELGVPHVVHLREYPSGHFEFWSYRHDYVQYLNRTSSMFIAVSESVKDAWVSVGLDRNRIAVIYDGVRFGESKSSILFREAGADSKINIIAVGGLSEMKGQWQLIEAMRMLPQDVASKYRIVVVGDGKRSYVSKFKEHVANSVKDNVVFLGNVDDAGSKMLGFQFGFMGSKNEAFGRVTAEYIESGLMPIVSESGANVEVAGCCSTGVSFPYGDTNRLAELLTEISRDRDRYVASARSAKKAKHLFSRQRCADDVCAVYDACLR